MRLRHRAYRDTRRGGPPSRVVEDAEARATREDKWCPGCERRLPLSAFGRNRASNDGLTAYCRPCHSEKSRSGHEKAHGSTRNFHLKRRYGITAQDYDRMAEAQGGLCAVCRQRPVQHVDHDHLTGQVRGLLCSGCNQGLGNFRDDADVLRLAATYVATHSWQKVREAPGVHRMVAPQGAPA